MRHPTKLEFQWLVFSGMVLISASAFMEESKLPQPPAEIANALDWNYYGSSLSYESMNVIYTLLSVGYGIGFLGFLFFKEWGRWVILACWGAHILVTPFLGLYVTRGLPSALSQIGGFLFLVPFILSFFTPCSSYFVRQPGGEENPSGASDKMTSHED